MIKFTNPRSEAASFKFESKESHTLPVTYIRVTGKSIFQPDRYVAEGMRIVSHSRSEKSVS